MANNGNSMHFVRYSHPIADNGATDYLCKKENKERQKIIWDEYQELNKYDTPCSSDTLFKKRLSKINYFDGNIANYSMYYYKIVNTRKKNEELLSIWVGYDIGGTDNLTGQKIERGYYLYYTNLFRRKKASRKLLLLSVSRQSDLGLLRAVELAKRYTCGIVKHYSPNYEVDWDNPILVKHSDKYLFMENNLANLREFRSILNCEIW